MIAPTILRLDIDPLKVQVLARRRTAVNPHADVVPRGTGGVGPLDILDAEPAGTTVSVGVDAGRDLDKLVGVGESNILEGNIPGAPGAWVGLYPGCFAAVCESDVIKDDIVDVVWL